jgi:hypothetical protein
VWLSGSPSNWVRCLMSLAPVWRKLHMLHLTIHRATCSLRSWRVAVRKTQ